MVTFSPEMLAKITGGAVKLDVLLYVQSTPTPIRVWTGVGPLTIPADSVDTAGGTYLGIGRLVGFPALSQLINGVAERVEFTLSGVDPDALRLADQDAEGLRAAEAFCGLAIMDDVGAIIDATFWVWNGESDTPKISRTGGDGRGPVTRQVSLSVGSPMTGRRRAGLSYFTGVDQRRRDPTDAFCDRVNLYPPNATVRWPS